VLTSPNGKEALDHLHHAHTNNALPSLIIMDLFMPKMNGVEAIGEIRNNQLLSNIPIIVITEAPTDQQREYFKKFNIKMVKKPSSYEQLLQELEIVMDQYLN
jgi:CheY-like chemotaxis protein